ncbi:mannitol dehydrogenase [Bosea sp. PAMC 26642]|nr:mannitol dehydrogenase [Bosea sp. PAMC 26642]
MPLSTASLRDLPTDVATPRYDRAAVTPGIVHFGVGNFHRSHQAVYLDDLMNAGAALDWGIVGAGVTVSDAGMAQRLASQDFLTTLVEQDENGRRVRVIGSIIDFVRPGDTAALLAKLADPQIRIVSLTITEGGYFIDATTSRFDVEHPDIQRDALDIANPTTVFGYLVEGLRLRRAAGLPPFTIMSCDNIPHNGDVTSDAVLQFARRIDPDLAEWIAAEVRFPNGMVDRITPATTDGQRQWLEANHGLSDAAPVFSETFRQWVLQDDFCNGRPPLENAGVAFVADVTPFEIMKIRILNGGHAAIAYPAALLGIHFVHDAMRHPLIAGFLEKLTGDEIIPQTPPVPGTDLLIYQAEIARRFANPEVGDTVQRLCLDGSNRQPKFIVPAIADSLANGGRFSGLALVSALWCRYCLGRTEDGRPIAPNDPNWEGLSRVAQAAQTTPTAWLAMQDVYGAVGDHPDFVSSFEDALRSLASDGVSATLQRWLKSGG